MLKYSENHNATLELFFKTYFMLKLSVGSLQPSRKDIYDKNFKFSAPATDEKKKFMGNSLRHSLQQAYIDN